MTIPFHPLANLFPLIDGAAFDEFVADVRANGLREKIVILDGQILDGRNRYRAGIAAGLIDADAPAHDGIGMQAWCELYLPEYQGEPLAWVLSRNLHRRHLSESQRAMIAARVETYSHGGARKGGDQAANLQLDREAASELLHVSPRSAASARHVQEHGAPELIEAVDRGDVAVSAAAAVAKLPVAEQLEILRSSPPKGLAQAARDKQINGARALMASRREPDDSLDYFPTPPWATRALLEDVMPGHIGPGTRIWEPACGEGHMTGVLLEYSRHVLGTDIFDYSNDGRSAPGWDRALNFLGASISAENKADWIITNPPFGDAGLAFVLRALELAEGGVAMFFRQQWLEGVERYEQLFSCRPPTLYAQFSERVNLCKGRWDEGGSTATAYCWLVWQRGWLKGKPPGLEPRLMWIPPGRRIARSRPDDVARFTAHPVLPPSEYPRGESGTAREASGGQPLPGDGDIGDLQQGAQPAPRTNSQAKTSEGKADTTAEAASDGDASRPSRSGDSPASYADELAASLAEIAPGKFHQSTAEAVMRAGYAAAVPIADLARDLGHPPGTIKTWANRLGLTDRQRELATRFGAPGAMRAPSRDMRQEEAPPAFDQLKSSVPDWRGQAVTAGDSVMVGDEKICAVRRVYKNGNISVDGEHGHQLVVKAGQFARFAEAAVAIEEGEGA